MRLFRYECRSIDLSKAYPSSILSHHISISIQNIIYNLQSNQTIDILLYVYIYVLSDAVQSIIIKLNTKGKNSTFNEIHIHLIQLIQTFWLSSSMKIHALRFHRSNIECS